MKLTPRQRAAVELVATGNFIPCLVREDDGWYARWQSPSDPENGWVDEYVREAVLTRLSEDAEEQRHETLHDAWMMALKSRTGLVVWEETECRAFAEELKEWSGNAQEDVAARQAIAFAFEGTPDAAFSVACVIPKGRRALKALGQATFVFPPLLAMARKDEVLSVSLTRAEAESFVRSGAKDLRDAGYRVAGVDLTADISAEAELDCAEKVGSPVRARLVVRVAGQPVTADEIRFLLDQGSSLVYFRDHWIEVDRDILRQALRALEKQGGKIDSPIRFALGIGRIGALEIAEARAGGWLRGLVSRLRAKMPDAAEDHVPDLHGTLRDYQARGVAWIRFLTDNGFGALLADDMGLGKTIQTIAWILQSCRGKKTLVVAPLTLLENWRHEFVKFAPKLKVAIHQGVQRHCGSGFRRMVAAADVVVTSYGLLVRDYRDIGEVKWDALVLDEAQVIKNSETKAAQAVRALTPARRLALTGTPVENTVADVWSIEEFLNPGFLGDEKSFFERFVKPIAADEQSVAAKRLRHALEPFVLRRVKSDPAIAAELGPKREIKEYCALAVEQRQAYEAALVDFRVREHTAGEIFALLTELKLVCDGLTDASLVAGGKADRLAELVESIWAGGESCLIFTQYAKVGVAIKRFLEARFHRPVQFLHGGLDLSARTREIAAFNRRRAGAFVLSLKAGGFGLNLTKATHVIHYDRWWNPAVENQATDRAHRIGQAKTVFVHLFITSGTLEEHVDEMLERKSRVAGSVISEREWLEAVRLDKAD